MLQMRTMQKSGSFSALSKASEKVTGPGAPRWGCLTPKPTLFLAIMQPWWRASFLQWPTERNFFTSNHQLGEVKEPWKPLGSYPPASRHTYQTLLSDFSRVCHARQDGLRSLCHKVIFYQGVFFIALLLVFSLEQLSNTKKPFILSNISLSFLF